MSDFESLPVMEGSDDVPMGRLTNGLEQRLEELLIEYKNENLSLQKLAEKVALNLLASRKVSTREKLLCAGIGMFLPGVLLVGCLTWVQVFSTAAKLSRANVRVSVSTVKKGVEVKVSGPKILDASKENSNEAVIQFEKSQ